MTERIKPYFVFPDCCYADETKIGEQFVKLQGEQFYWVFGMYNRDYRLPIMYYV